MLLNVAGTDLCCCVAETLCVDRSFRAALLILNSDLREGGGAQSGGVEPQLRSLLQWAAASLADAPHIQLTRDKDLKQVISSRPRPPLVMSTGSHVSSSQCFHDAWMFQG